MKLRDLTTRDRRALLMAAACAVTALFVGVVLTEAGEEPDFTHALFDTSIAGLTAGAIMLRATGWRP